jgi:hypothetical protein
MLQLRSTQWNILKFQLAATGVIFSLAQNHHRTSLLLIIPVVTYALVSQYLGNSEGQVRIGTYIRGELSPRVPGGLPWEGWQIQNPSNHIPLLKLLGITSWVAPLPAVFPGVSIVALTWVAPYIVSERSLSAWSRSLLGGIWVLCLIITIASLYLSRRIFYVSRSEHSPLPKQRKWLQILPGSSKGRPHGKDAHQVSPIPAFSSFPPVVPKPRTRSSAAQSSYTPSTGPADANSHG